jgi:hypothetical protein
MAETAKHSPTPWKSQGHKVITDWQSDIIDEVVANCVVVFNHDASEQDNADFIVRACNAHEDLLAACKAIHEDICDRLLDVDSPGTRQTMETQRDYLAQAIAKAEQA